MEHFKFYKAQEVYREKYYQLPMVFFTSEKYKNMSNDAKVAYTLLKARFDISIKNHWVDEEENIYFNYTVENLMKMLNCREGKVSKIKKELVESGLLYQKRRPPLIVNGKKEGQPNYLYLGKPEVSAEDVFRTDQLDLPSQIAKNAIQEEHRPDSLSHQIAKNAIQENPLSQTDISQIANLADNISYSSPSTRHIKDTRDTEREELRNAMLLDHFHETQQNTFLSIDTLKFVALFSDTIHEAHNFVGIIIRAKAAAEKERNKTFIAEDFQEELDAAIRKLVHKIKTDSKIQNKDNYLFSSLKEFFCDCISLVTNHNSDLPDINLPVFD